MMRRSYVPQTNASQAWVPLAYLADVTGATYVRTPVSVDLSEYDLLRVYLYDFGCAINGHTNMQVYDGAGAIVDGASDYRTANVNRDLLRLTDGHSSDEHEFVLMPTAFLSSFYSIYGGSKVLSRVRGHRVNIPGVVSGVRCFMTDEATGTPQVLTAGRVYIEGLKYDTTIPAWSTS